NAPLACFRGSSLPEGAILRKKRELLQYVSIKSAKGDDERHGGRRRRRDSRTCVQNLASGRISARIRCSTLAKSRGDLAGRTATRSSQPVSDRSSRLVKLPESRRLYNTSSLQRSTAKTRFRATNVTAKIWHSRARPRLIRPVMRPTRGFSVLLPYRDYVYLSVAIGIYSSV